MERKLLLLILLLTCFKCVFAQTIYPDKKLPLDLPLIFARRILSDGLSNRDFTMSPTGDEIFFTIQHPKFLTSTIITLKKTDGVWGKPQVATFSGIYRDLEASFSADGNTLFFSSDRPLNAGSPSKDFDIWKVSRTKEGKWGMPVNLGRIVNSDKNEFYPSVAKNGNLYFTAAIPSGMGIEDIVVCKNTLNGYSAPVSLSAEVNSKFDEYNAFIDPDEQFIIFSSEGRIDDMGRGDLYISKKGRSGNWMPARHLPAPINSQGIDYCPYVTPDKKYLIFTSNRLNKQWDNDKAVNYTELKRLLTQPGNGLDDIYWVKFNLGW